MMTSLLPDQLDVEKLKIVGFDLDDTLAASKSPLSEKMGRTLADLLECVPVQIISGGRFEQFDAQVLANLPKDAELENLHLMPTCGTRYLRFVDGQWKEIYFHALSQQEKDAAIGALEEEAKRLNLWEPDDVVNGDRIEDRGSQITFSALGQRASVADKQAWDPSDEKRESLRDAVAKRIPELEVRAGGSTSIDITRKGIDKAYGMRALSEQAGIELSEMLFIGDRLVPGGNDYPVYEIGVPCHQVSGPEETLTYLGQLIELLRKKRG